MSLPPITFDGEVTLTATEQSELLNLPSLLSKIKSLQEDIPDIKDIVILTYSPDSAEVDKAWHGKLASMAIVAKTVDDREVITKVRRTKKGSKKRSYKWNWRAKWKWANDMAIVTKLCNGSTMVTVNDKSKEHCMSYKINQNSDKVTNHISSHKWKNISRIVDDMYQRQLRVLLVKRNDDKLTEFGWLLEGGKWICRPTSKTVDSTLRKWYDNIKSSLPSYQRSTVGYFRSESAYDPEQVRQSWMPYVRRRELDIVKRQRRVWKEYGMSDHDEAVSSILEGSHLIDWDYDHIKNVAKTMTGKQLSKSAGFPWIGLTKRDVCNHSLGLFESKSLGSIAAFSLPDLEEIWNWETTVIAPGIRTQAAKSSTKSRLIHIVPCDVFLRERALWYKAWELWNSDMWYGKDDLAYIGNVIYNRSSPDTIGSWIKVASRKYKTSISVDWSGFDASLSRDLVCDVISDTLSHEFGEWYRDRDVIFKSPWDDINNMPWVNGLLSGSQLTSWIGSKWNAAMIRYFMDELDMEEYEASVQGDDGLIFMNASPDIVHDISTLAKSLGFVMHPDKVYAKSIRDTKKLFGPDDPVAEYLKRWYFTDGQHRLFMGRAMNRLFRRERSINPNRLSDEEAAYLAEKFSDHIHVLKHYDTDLEGLRRAIRHVLGPNIANVITNKLLGRYGAGEIIW